MADMIGQGLLELRELAATRNRKEAFWIIAVVSLIQQAYSVLNPEAR